MINEYRLAHDVDEILGTHRARNTYPPARTRHAPTAPTATITRLAWSAKATRSGHRCQYQREGAPGQPAGADDLAAPDRHVGTVTGSACGCDLVARCSSWCPAVRGAVVWTAPALRRSYKASRTGHMKHGESS
jgi:hypothetical protein